MTTVHVVTQSFYADSGAGFQGARSAEELATLQIQVIGVFSDLTQAKAAAAFGGKVHTMDMDAWVSPYPARPEQPYDELGHWGKLARDLRHPISKEHT